MTPVPAAELDALAERVRRLETSDRRLLVAIVGAPGAGKSTLAEALVHALGPDARVLPMDGYHLSNEELSQMGLLHRKGAPQTFDAAGFVELLRHVKTDRAVSYPTFDRALDTTVPDAGRIDEDTKIVVVEGNYLLLEQSPWCSAAPLFDLTVFLEVDRAELEARLIRRWIDHGLPRPQAESRARENDLPNADTVITTSRAADVTLRLG